MGNYPIGLIPGLALQAATPAAGYPLVNGTGTILSWTTPNDGAQHRIMLFSSILVASTETGGLIQIRWQGPGATANQDTQIFAANLTGQTASQPPSNQPTLLVVQPNYTVLLRQASAMTAGSATLYAELWGA